MFFLFMNEEKGKKKSFVDVYAKNNFFLNIKPVLFSIHNLVKFIRNNFIQPFQPHCYCVNNVIFTLFNTTMSDDESDVSPRA